MRCYPAAFLALLLFLLPNFQSSLFAQERLYWANNNIGILSANKDGTGLDTLVKGDIVGITSISIDSLNQKVYWIDASKKQFGRMNYDGSEIELVFKLEDQSPDNIFVEPVEQKLYWFDHVSNTFWKADLDGSQREVVTGALPGANSPKYIVDQSEERIYWLNSSANKIQSRNLIDQSVQDVVVSSFDTAIIEFRIDFANDKIYWLNFEFQDLFKEIRRRNLDGTEEEVIFSFQYDSYDFNQEFDIDPLHKRLIIVHQPTYNSVYYVLIGNLDGTNLGQHGFLLTDDNTQLHFDANSNDLFFLGYGPYGIYRNHIEGSNGTVTNLTRDAMISPRGIAVDHANGKIYWTDGTTLKIQRCNLDGSEIEVLLQHRFFYPPPLIDPGAIALDVANNYMYWSSRGAGAISRAHLDGSDHEVLISNLFNPQGLALDTAKQKMYFTLQGNAGIYRANTDGTGLEQLISLDGTETGFPDQLALDLENRHIYWSSNKLGIARANLDGTNMDTVWAATYGKDSGIALDINNEKVYWIVDSTLQSVNFTGSVKENIITGMRIPASFGGYLTFNDTHAYQANLEPGSVCTENDLTLSGMATANTVEWAVNTLSSMATISNGSIVHYKAGSAIHLLPGFSAQSGSRFKAKIEACAAMLTRETINPDDLVTDLAQHPGIDFMIAPNPVDQTTRMGWVLPQESVVQISLYSISGTLIRNLAAGTFPEGRQMLDVDLGDLASGIYVVVFQAGKLFQAKKLVVN